MPFRVESPDNMQNYKVAVRTEKILFIKIIGGCRFIVANRKGKDFQKGLFSQKQKKMYMPYTGPGIVRQVVYLLG